jgi:hypothetical protein
MFMYLHLRTDRDGKIHAEVKSHGALGFSSLGGPTSKRSDLPFAVFEIDDFTGLGAIDEDSLFAELFRRVSTKELLRRIGCEFTNSELIEMLQERMRT